MKKIIIDLPLDLFNAATAKDAKDKPYNVCLSCPYRTTYCDGPQCLAMSYTRWVEWINTLAKKQKLTRAEIAELADLPLPTVISALSGKAKDIKMYTAAAITRAVKGGTWGQYPCHFVAMMMNSEIVELDSSHQASQLKNNLDEKEKQLQDLKEEHQRKIDFLREQIKFKENTILESRNLLKNALAENADLVKSKNKTVRALVVCLGALAAAVIIFLAVDAFLPHIGWFRY